MLEEKQQLKKPLDFSQAAAFVAFQLPFLIKAEQPLKTGPNSTAIRKLMNYVYRTNKST